MDFVRSEERRVCLIRIKLPEKRGPLGLGLGDNHVI